MVGLTTIWMPRRSSGRHGACCYLWISDTPRGVERFFLVIPTQTLRRNYMGFEEREYFPKHREISPQVGKISID